MVAAVVALGRRGPAELGAEDDQRVVQQPPLLQVAQQAGDRLVDLLGVRGVVVAQVAVGVPVVARVAVVHLHEPHAGLDQPPGQQALPAVLVGRLLADAVQGVRLRCSPPTGRTPSGPSTCMRKASSNVAMRASSRGVGAGPRQVVAVRAGRAGRAAAAAGRRRRPGVVLASVAPAERRAAVADARPLERRRQEGRAVVLRPAVVERRAERDEAGQVAGSRCPGRRASTPPGSGG